MDDLSFTEQSPAVARSHVVDVGRVAVGEDGMEVGAWWGGRFGIKASHFKGFFAPAQSKANMETFVQ